MTKFSTIWGDMELGTQVSQSAPVKPEEKKDPAPTKLDDTSEPEGDDNTDHESEVIETEEKETETPTEGADDKKSEGEETEEVEFTEDDVNKAFTMLEDEGVLELDDEFEAEATPAGLADAVALTVRKKLEKEIATIPPVVQDFYKHVMEGKDALTFRPRVEVDWGEVLQTEEKNQKTAYYQFLKDQGLADEDIQSEVDDAVERGLLEKKSKIAFNALITKQEKNKELKVQKEADAEKQAQKQREKDIEEINKTIDKMDEFAGFKLDDKKKQSFKDYLFKINPRTGKTQMQENMVSDDRRLRVAFLDFVDYNKKDLEKEVTSSVTNQRKKKLSRYSDKSVSSSNSSRSVTQKPKEGGRGRIKFPTIFGNQEIEVED